MKKRNKIILTISIIVSIFLGLVFISQYTPNNYQKFAECLTDNGLAMGGAIWCGHCQTQKTMFGGAFTYIDYHECSTDDWCSEVGIRGYPTWVDSEGNLYEGVQDFENLAKISGCQEP